MPSPDPQMLYNFPRQFTPFIGRRTELAEIKGLLADSACNLLTLVGPGGIGKTRLAAEVAAGQRESFSHGVYFVPLQTAETYEMLVTAIADALNLALQGQQSPRLQMLDYLSDRNLLLLLDNFEQLLSTGSAELVADILAEAPGVKLLVTSRELLNLQEEWLYYVQGMPFPSVSHLPEDKPLAELEGYDAVQLFVERTRRVRRDFSAGEELGYVVRICQLVEGMPLAIELAAAWVKTMPCQVIAEEIQRNLDFLATRLRNVPERQRSMRVVFEQSWQLLTPPERKAFMRLSVFRGGFWREAAERVAGASLAILSALVDKSLLRPEPDGRYHVHELLRQCASEELVQSPGDVGQIYDMHCAYYADFLHARHEEILHGRQREVTAEIEAELENIRAAWQWAVELRRVDDIKKAAIPLDSFYQYQSRFVEGAAAFQKAVQGLESQPASEQTERVMAELLVCLGWYYIRLGRFDDAQRVIERGQAIYTRQETGPIPGVGTDPRIGLGILAIIRGNYARAEELGDHARQASAIRGDQHNLAVSHYVLTAALLAEGKYETARDHARQACELAQAVNDRWFLAYCLNEWGNVARAMGDYAEARQHYQASYAIRAEFDDPEGVAVALNHLGRVAVLQEKFDEAAQLYDQSLAVYRQLNDQGGLATALNGLGTIAWANSEYETARQYFQEALQIATEIQFVPLLLSMLLGSGELLLETNRAAPGLELLALVRRHPASERETKERAERCLTHYQAHLPEELFNRAMDQDRPVELDSMVALAQTELAMPLTAKEERQPSPGVASPPDMSALVEPLTDRELEVLGLIAQGLTNQQIADELVISVGTVKFYTSQIYGKLGVNSRTQAVARARELGLLG